MLAAALSALRAGSAKAGGQELGYHQTVMDLVFHANAEHVLGL